MVAAASMGKAWNRVVFILSRFGKPAWQPPGIHPRSTIMEVVRIVLISTYELGRQPFGLASPAAWLRADGHSVTVADVAYSPVPWPAVEEAQLIAFFLPMHTATRLFQKLVDKVRSANSQAHLCGYGLYAPLNDPLLRRLGVQTVIGGEL